MMNVVGVSECYLSKRFYPVEDVEGKERIRCCSRRTKLGLIDPAPVFVRNFVDDVAGRVM
jgi:hypothetical protein